MAGALHGSGTPLGLAAHLAQNKFSDVGGVDLVVPVGGVRNQRLHAEGTRVTTQRAVVPREAGSAKAVPRNQTLLSNPRVGSHGTHDVELVGSRGAVGHVAHHGAEGDLGGDEAVDRELGDLRAVARHPADDGDIVAHVVQVHVLEPVPGLLAPLADQHHVRLEKAAHDVPLGDELGVVAQRAAPLDGVLHQKLARGVGVPRHHRAGDDDVLVPEPVALVDQLEDVAELSVVVELLVVPAPRARGVHDNEVKIREVQGLVHITRGLEVRGLLQELRHPWLAALEGLVVDGIHVGREDVQSHHIHPLLLENERHADPQLAAPEDAHPLPLRFGSHAPRRLDRRRHRRRRRPRRARSPRSHSILKLP
mmetsp:Transcript_6649/g.20045  ORF Transcript_6649/g.20045 Transcript_6649/m.20045 type:complete len:365 (-) Transcript_6649:60-1154(-)